MCRNIRPLANFDPPSTDDEIRAAATQFVCKIGGFAHPSKVNADAFATAIDAIVTSSAAYLASLETSAPPRDRAVEAAKAKARSVKRFA